MRAHTHVPYKHNTHTRTQNTHSHIRAQTLTDLPHIKANGISEEPRGLEENFSGPLTQRLVLEGRVEDVGVRVEDVVSRVENVGFRKRVRCSGWGYTS